jgi:hypothetical protein
VSDEKPPGLLTAPAAATAATATAAPIALKGKFQWDARSYFKTAATAEQKATLQQ